MRGARMGMLATALVAGLMGLAQPFKEAFAKAHASPQPPPDTRPRKNKNRGGSARPSGAAAAKRAAKKLRCARARQSKRRA